MSRERDQVRWPQAEQRTTVHVVRVSISGVVRYIGRLEADVLGQILIGVHLVMPGKFRIRYTIEPPIKDPPNRKYHSMKDTL